MGAWVWLVGGFLDWGRGGGDDGGVRVGGGLGVVLLLVGCRQPNPEWKGADEGAVSTDEGGTTTEGPGSTMPPADVTTVAPDPTTEGQDCNNDQQCPDGWVCGPMGCQLGGDGDPCSGAGDCQAPTSLCGPNDMCQDGNAGDPCGDNGDCMMPTAICGPSDVCQAGEAGDPCSSQSHCVGGLMCTDSVCG